jgi:hypothetical protein
MINLDRVHFIINEMAANGFIISTNKAEIYEPIDALDKVKDEK